MTKQTINTGNTANDGTGDGLRTAFTKVNNNFTELYNLTSEISNTWINPQTSNTFNVIQVSGATKVSLPPGNTASLNTVSNRTGSALEVYVLKNPQSNAIFQPIFAGNTNTSEFTITIGSNTSSGSINSETSFEWVLLYNDGPISYDANVSTVNVSIIYESTPQPWFDPEELGITDFRGAKLFYHAYVDKSGSFNQIGEIMYSASDGLRYGSQNQYDDSRYLKQNINLSVRQSTDKLHYRNTSTLSGNLYIQWSGVVFTGKDRSDILDEN